MKVKSILIFIVTDDCSDLQFLSLDRYDAVFLAGFGTTGRTEWMR